jgi:hypothetical protein
LRLLERQENADIARRRIERTDEGDEEEWPEVVEPDEGNTGQNH